MKKIIPALLIGAALGGGATWVALRKSPAAAPEEPAPGLASAINPDTASIVKEMAAVGLNTALPGTTLLAPEAKAYGRVVDPTPLIALAAEVSTAQAAASASTRDFERTRILHGQNANASLQAVESAEAAMLRDRTQLASAQSRLVAGWGPALANRSGLQELLGSLAAGDTALVRIDLLTGESLVPKSARVAAAAGEPSWRDVELLGPSPTADSQIGGASWLALWKNPALRAGAALRVEITGPGEPRPALVVPGSAIVRHQGGTFVYVQSSDHGFERRLVTLGNTTEGGTVVSDGLKPTEKVVVTGAQQLLSTEVMGAGGGEEE